MPSNSKQLLDQNAVPAPMSGFAKLRRLMLFTLLAVMIFAIVYDYQIARPAVAAAYDQITIESRRLNAQSGGTFSNIDVQDLLGKAPSGKFTEGSHFIETYDFPGGIPGRPHRLYTVFKQNGSQKLFYRHAKFVYETGKEVAPFPEIEVMAISEAEAEMMRELEKAETEQYTLLGAYGPRKMFEAMDTNADGQLQRDEMSEGVKTALDSMEDPVGSNLTWDRFEALFFAESNPDHRTSDAADHGRSDDMVMPEKLGE